VRLCAKGYVGLQGLKRGLHHETHETAVLGDGAKFHCRDVLPRILLAYYALGEPINSASYEGPVELFPPDMDLCDSAPVSLPEWGGLCDDRMTRWRAQEEAARAGAWSSLPACFGMKWWDSPA